MARARVCMWLPGASLGAIRTNIMLIVDPLRACHIAGYNGVVAV